MLAINDEKCGNQIGTPGQSKTEIRDQEDDERKQYHAPSPPLITGVSDVTRNGRASAPGCRQRNRIRVPGKADTQPFEMLSLMPGRIPE